MHLTCDYHTHPQAHVLQPYTPGLLQPWIEQARQTGIQSLAFTDHDRYHAGIAFDVVERLREANPDVDLLLGIELDNDPVTSAAGSHWVERHWDKLDFVLGSVHYLPGAATMFDRADQTAQLTAQFGLERAFSLYLDELDKLLRCGLIDCLAHLDLIKIHRLYPPDYDAARWFQPILAKVAASGLAMEASTAGWRKAVGEQYPSSAILALAGQMGVSITTASDAHAPAQLSADYDRLEATLDEAGIQTTVRFRKHETMNSSERQ
ncbi:MAG TPA: PHP domain-containing protein [Chthoniobacterales bacterium]